MEPKLNRATILKPSEIALSKAALRDAPREQVEQVNGRPADDTGIPGRWEEETSDTAVSPLAPDDGRYVSKAEYWAKWYEHPYPDIDVSYEWNNGILEAKPLPTPSQIELYNWFLDLMRRYTQSQRVHGARGRGDGSSQPIARLINLETGFNLTMPDPAELSGMREAVRKPDIGVVRFDNRTPWEEDDRAFKGVCDMCVESVSDSTLAEARRDTEEKKRDYALAGVQEYFILDPSGRHMRFYRLGAGGRYEEIQPDAEGVIRSAVLPGFQFRRRDLFRRPDIEELALDEVYSGYVLPGYQAAVARADREAQRADTEATARQRAEEQATLEARRADTEAAARRAAEERAQALEAELARLRQQRS